MAAFGNSEWRMIHQDRLAEGFPTVFGMIFENMPCALAAELHAPPVSPQPCEVQADFELRPTGLRRSLGYAFARRAYIYGRRENVSDPVERAAQIDLVLLVILLRAEFLDPSRAHAFGRQQAP
jgi:hypothetical protein